MTNERKCQIYLKFLVSEFISCKLFVWLFSIRSSGLFLFGFLLYRRGCLHGYESFFPWASHRRCDWSTGGWAEPGGFPEKLTVRMRATASGRWVPSPVLPPAGILFDEKNKLTNVWCFWRILKQNVVTSNFTADFSCEMTFYSEFSLNLTSTSDFSF